MKNNIRRLDQVCSRALWMFVSVLLTAKWTGALEQKQVTALFVFGDSLVDYGNNDYLNSFTRANFLPNGIDMPDQIPTGRYCNGRVVPDFISEYMGNEGILPYLDPNGTIKLWQRGVNFASAGAGILLDTGSIFNQRLEFQTQIDAFVKVLQNLTSGSLGINGTYDLVRNALFLINMGSNDYINNYLLLPPATSPRRKYGYIQYQNLLLRTFRQQLKELYYAGARKIVVSNIGPIGCIPHQLALRSRNGSCVTRLNTIVSSYNKGLKHMLEDMRRQFPDGHFLYADTYSVTMDYIKHAELGGFKLTNIACCGMGVFHGLVPCNPLVTVCSNRSEYIFWDPFHPTEAFNALFTDRIIYGPINDVSPINIKQLLEL